MKKKLKDLPEWTSLKSGAMRHRDGKWYASLYADGWFFYHFIMIKEGVSKDSYSKTCSAPDGHIGPFKSFEDGLKTWKNT
jgi:hypothetical protein